MDVSPRGAATGVKGNAGDRDDEKTRADRTPQTCVSMHNISSIFSLCAGRQGEGKANAKGKGGTKGEHRSVAGRSRCLPSGDSGPPKMFWQGDGNAEAKGKSG